MQPSSLIPQRKDHNTENSTPDSLQIVGSGTVLNIEGTLDGAYGIRCIVNITCVTICMYKGSNFSSVIKRALSSVGLAAVLILQPRRQ